MVQTGELGQTDKLKLIDTIIIITVNSFLLLTDFMGIERLLQFIQMQIHGKTVQHAHQCQLNQLVLQSIYSIKTHKSI